MSEHLTIVLITYRRTDYALRTINNVCDNLRYPNFSWYVADDGSDEAHVNTILETLDRRKQSLLGWHREPISYGAGANRGVRLGLDRGDLVLMLEDDWALEQPLDIWAWCALLMEQQEIGMVRMGYINAGIDAQLVSLNGSLYWALNDERSRTFSSFAFAGHPSIIHRRFFDEYGYYPERWQPGETELKMCWQVAALDGPLVVWPITLGERGPWGHIGAHQSYQWNGGVQL